MAHALTLPAEYIAALLAVRTGKPEVPVVKKACYLPNIDLDEWSHQCVVSCGIGIDAFLTASPDYQKIGIIGFEPVYFWPEHGLYAYEQAFCTYELCFSYPWRAPAWLYKANRNCQWEDRPGRYEAPKGLQATLNF